MLNFIKNILKLSLVIGCFQLLLAETNSFRIGLQNGISSENFKNISPQIGVKLFPRNNLIKNIDPILSVEYIPFYNGRDYIHHFPILIKGRYKILQNKFYPFIELGGGASFTSYSFSDEGPLYYKDYLLESGLGIAVPITNKNSLIFMSNYTTTSSNLIDNDPNSKNDGYFSFSADFVFSLNLLNLGSNETRVEAPNSDSKINTKRIKYSKWQKDSLEQLNKFLNELDKDVQKIDQRKNEYFSKIRALILLIKEKNVKIDTLRTYIALQKQLTIKSDESEKDVIAAKGKFIKSMKLFENKKYSRAANNFNTLFQKYSKYQFSSIFAYWAGESYYQMNLYDQSVKYFTYVLNNNIDEIKDEALLMKGICLFKMGRNPDAKSQFQKLVNDYPDSVYHKLSQYYLDQSIYFDK